MIVMLMLMAGCMLESYDLEPYDPYNPEDPSPCIQPPSLLDAMRPQVYRPPEQETKPVCGKETTNNPSGD